LKRPACAAQIQAKLKLDNVERRADRRGPHASARRSKSDPQDIVRLKTKSVVLRATERSGRRVPGGDNRDSVSETRLLIDFSRS
jgi:hypothetical protein